MVDVLSNSIDTDGVSVLSEFEIFFYRMKEMKKRMNKPEYSQKKGDLERHFLKQQTNIERLIKAMKQSSS
jgi:hypothetical protein